jgi:hypothetical protein
LLTGIGYYFEVGGLPKKKIPAGYSNDKTVAQVA